jgi:Helix-turn-helix domain
MEEKYLTATEASRRYEIGERTIRQWITTGRLPAQTGTRDGHKIWKIQASDIERIIAEKHTTGIGTGSVPVELQRLAAMEHKLETLSLVVDALDFRVRSLEEEQRRARTAQKPVSLPVLDMATDPPEEGTLTMQEFAAHLGIERKTLLDSVLKYDLPHTAIPNPTRPREMKRSFTPEQQAAIIAWRKSH